MQRLKRKRPQAICMMDRRKRFRGRSSSGLSELPKEVVPWLEPHPANGHPSLTDQGAAILRLLRADGRVNKARQPVVFALMYTFFFREPPPFDLMPSGSSIDLSERVLAARDKEIMVEEFVKNLRLSPHARVYSLFDDTHHLRGERHVHFIATWDGDKRTPVPRLISLKPTPKKDASTNAKEDLDNLKSLGTNLIIERHGGSCSDHAAMAEGKELGKLVYEAATAIQASQEAAGGVSTERPPSEVHAVLGDEQHKHPLVWKAMSEGIFGADTGGIQNVHHKQLLYQLWFQIEQDKEALLFEIRNFMGNDHCINGKMPRKMCTTRWQFVGQCAESWLQRKDEKDASGKPAFPGLFRHMAGREEKGSVPFKGWEFLANHCMDPRMVFAMTWETEHNERWTTLSAWNRAPSRQGFDPGYRIMDIVERCTYDDEDWWQRALHDPGDVYPKTLAFLKEEMGDQREQYLSFLEKGIALGRKEHLKLYAYQSEPKFLVLHLFCCGKSGSCMRAIAAVLVERLPGIFSGKGFEAPLEGREDDRFYVAKLASDAAKDELISYWHHWGLDNPDVVSDLVDLSKNKEDSRTRDHVTYEFVHGNSHKAIFSHLCVSLAPLPTTCVIVELLFSQMKIVQMANETSSSVDDELMLIFNVLGEMRKSRREMLDHTKGGGSSRHLHTKEQILQLCEQALAMLERYSPQAMAASSPSKRSCVGLHRDKDMDTAKRGAASKSAKRDARRALPRSNQDWDAAEAAAHALPHAVQVEAAALMNISRRQRVFAVVMEEKIRGQANGESMFWSKLKGGARGLLKELGVLLPLVHSALLKRGGAKMARQEALKDEEVRTVTTTGKVYELTTVRIDERVSHTFVLRTPKPESSISLRAPMKRIGLLAAARSLREAFLGRESTWKPGSGAVEGEVTIKGGRIQRGFACLYCMREGRKLQHWGSVSCFLTPEERMEFHFFLMNTHVGRLLRLKSAAVAVAANREGGASWRAD